MTNSRELWIEQLDAIVMQNTLYRSKSLKQDYNRMSIVRRWGSEPCMKGQAMQS
jgi:hypothetical protein